MINVAKLEQIVTGLGDEGMQIRKEQLLDIVAELRLGNAARLAERAATAFDHVCANIMGVPA